MTTMRDYDALPVTPLADDDASLASGIRPVRGHNQDPAARVDWFDGTPYDFCSNFHPSRFKMTIADLLPLVAEPVRAELVVLTQNFDTVTAETGEAAFQAMKANSYDHFLKVFTAADPGHAKGLGRRRGTMRDDWTPRAKSDAMLATVRAKFAQNEDIAQRLLATGGALLVEGNTWGDRIWGVCDGQGENLLGLCLMQVRAEIRLERGLVAPRTWIT